MGDQREVEAGELGRDGAKGAAQALDEAGPGEPPAAVADQLALPIGAKQPGAPPPVAVRSGRGRPAGSKNRVTRAWAAYIAQAYGSPLEALASVYAQDVRALAAHLGCSALEAIKVQLRAAELVAPYVHAKQPVQVEGGGTYAPTSIFVGAQMEQALIDSLLSQGVSTADLAAIGRGDYDASAYIERDQGVIDHQPITGNHQAELPPGDAPPGGQPR